MVAIHCPKCGQDFETTAFEKAIEKGESFMVAKCPCGMLVFGKKTEQRMPMAS